MKYLYGHGRTEKLLRTWARPSELVKASHFFWNAGTEMQKSQVGLLQSLLFEILRKYPGLIQTICLSRWRNCRDSSRYSFDPWTRKELLEAFRELFCQTLDDAKFCFF